MTWDPVQYLKYGGERLRPALDLLARVPLEAPETVIDLGCGAGNVTQALRRRWPDPATRITGVDSSPEMLARARTVEPEAQWLEADIATWEPRSPVDVIFSNATLHWLPDHASLFRRLMGFLAPGGVLAVQMPNQTGAPSHMGIGETIDAAATLAPEDKAALHALRVAPLAPVLDYHGFVAGAAASVDQWETHYTHVLARAPAGANAVVEWTRSTSLNPVLSALKPAQREGFLADYCARMDRAYPPRADGTTLFPFRRFFLVANRKE